MSLLEFVRFVNFVIIIIIKVKKHIIKKALIDDSISYVKPHLQEFAKLNCHRKICNRKKSEKQKHD